MFEEFLFVVDPYHWGPELNYEYYDEEQKCRPAVKFASDVVRYWIGEFHLDGIRFDAGKAEKCLSSISFDSSSETNGQLRYPA